MHELSVVMSIIQIASDEMRKAEASSIEEIELEIGGLSGIEMSSFDFAWQQAITGTPLAGTERRINHIEGKGKCSRCNHEFLLQNYFDPCPVCHDHLIEIISGKELRVKSLTVH